MFQTEPLNGAFFLADCNANFIEKLLKPQLINKLQNICEKLQILVVLNLYFPFAYIFQIKSLCKFSDTSPVLHKFGHHD